MAARRAEFPRMPLLDHRLSLVRELRENTPLSLVAAREQVDPFLQRRGVEIPPESPALVLFAILMLGVMAAVCAGLLVTCVVGGLLVLSGHADLAARHWPALLLGSGAGTGILVILTYGRGLWRNYRASSEQRGVSP